MDRTRWRASNLFAHPAEMQPVAAWHGRIRLEDAVPGAKLSVAIEGVPPRKRVWRMNSRT